MARTYPRLVGANKIKDEYGKINTIAQYAEETEARVDNILSDPTPGKDPELVDIRSVDPSYAPQREISVAGDVTRDMQAQFAAHKAEIAQLFNNVKSYGAMGDGVNDDTDSIQQAIDEVYAGGGGIVYFPAGFYLVRGLIIRDNVTLQGVGKQSSVIKLIDGSNQHVISTEDFDDLVGTNPGASDLVKSSGLKMVGIDGNKTNQTEVYHGLAYLGIDLQMEEVEIKNCLGIGAWIESSTGIWSVTADRNLQTSIRHIEVHDNEQGNMYYDGQSDSTMIDIMCYETGVGDGQFNFKLGPKAPGVRVFGLHCWGRSDYGLIVESSSAALTTCHIESASVAKVWLRTSAYFEGRVYQAGTGENLPYEAPAFQVDPGLSNLSIRATISNCETAVKYLGADGGNSLYDIQMYSTRPGSVLFSGTISSTNIIRARQVGAVTANVFMTPNMKQVPGSNYDFTTPGQNYAFYTDESKSMRQFGIEHANGATSWVAATGGTVSNGPALIARGPSGDLDMRLIPQGQGKVRFGTYKSGSGTISGYIEIKDATGTIRKLAVIS